MCADVKNTVGVKTFFAWFLYDAEAVKFFRQRGFIGLLIQSMRCLAFFNSLRLSSRSAAVLDD